MKEFSWQTPEHIHTKKNEDWYWTVGIVIAAIVIVAIIFGDFLFGLVIAISAFALALLNARPPRTIDVEVDAKGVNIDKTLYPFATLDAFYVDEVHHRGTRLMLKSKRVVMPLIIVPVPENSEDLRLFLVDHLKEEAFKESLLQQLFDRLGI